MQLKEFIVDSLKALNQDGITKAEFEVHLDEYGDVVDDGVQVIKFSVELS